MHEKNPLYVFALDEDEELWHIYDLDKLENAQTLKYIQIVRPQINNIKGQFDIHKMC